MYLENSPSTFRLYFRRTNAAKEKKKKKMLAVLSEIQYFEVFNIHHVPDCDMLCLGSNLLCLIRMYRKSLSRKFKCLGDYGSFSCWPKLWCSCCACDGKSRWFMGFSPNNHPPSTALPPPETWAPGALSVVNGSEMFRLRQVQAGCDLWPIDAAEQLAVLLVGIWAFSWPQFKFISVINFQRGGTKSSSEFMAWEIVVCKLPVRKQLFNAVRIRMTSCYYAFLFTLSQERYSRRFHGVKS